MADEVDLQRALLASLSHGRSSNPQPPSQMARTTESPRPPSRQPFFVPADQPKRPAGRAGERLTREGIAPATPSSPRKNAGKAQQQEFNQQRQAMRHRQRRASTGEPGVGEERQGGGGNEGKRGVEEGVGMSMAFGSGFAQCGSQGECHLDASQGKVVLADEVQARREMASKGIFSVNLDFKVSHTPPASGMVPSFALILHLNESRHGEPSYVGVRMDCSQRTVSLERADSGTASTLQSEKDRELRPGSWHSLRIDVSEDRLSVRRDGKLSLDSARPPFRLAGPLGLVASRAKLQWRGLRVDGDVRHASSGQQSQVGERGRGSNGSGVQQDEREKKRFEEWEPHLVEMIERDVVEVDMGVTFDDIASLDEAKRLLHEAVILPGIIPEYFTGIREPWKGVLLFGPPGTGKTMLAKAVAGTAGMSFFNCSSATLTSKWRGESEKLAKALFGLARKRSPAIIYLDEIDALCPKETDNEASRRFKSELLTQMDGVPSASEGSPDQTVIVLASTNYPWDLDEALRRRLEKRIYVPLPDLAARRRMLELHLRDVSLADDVNLDDVATRLDGFSGADIKLVCRDASMMPMRRLVQNKTPDEIRELKQSGGLEASLSAADFDAALSRNKPSVSSDLLPRFHEFASTFCSV